MRTQHFSIGALVVTCLLFALFFSSSLFSTASTGNGAAALAYTFSETFDGVPVAPQPWAESSTWDVAVHSRDSNSWYSLPSMDAAYGANCAPAGTHAITAYEDVVYQCANQLVTAINGAGYGSAVLMPNYMADFTDQETVIRFDASTFRSSTNDFFDIWITPFNEQLEYPVIGWMPDLVGEPKNAVHVYLDMGSTARFKGRVVRNFAVTDLPGTAQSWQGYESFLTPSTTPETFELRITSTSLKFGMPDHDFWWVDTTFAALGWTQGVVQFGHQSNNPAQPCGNDGSCGANSWRWDNISIYPSTPFTLLHADRRYVDASNGAAVAFTAAAPANSYLRFAAVGNSMEVSFDGGLRWEAAALQAQSRYDTAKFQTYWMPIPAGTTGVMIRGLNWWGGGWHARDIAVFSQTTGPLPTLTPTIPVTPSPTNTVAPTNTPTLTPTPTNTPIPPTATPTSTPTVIPTRAVDGYTIRYTLDRSAVPAVSFRDLTLKVQVGNVQGVQVFTANGVYIPHVYDAANGTITFTTDANVVDVTLIGAANPAAAGAVTKTALRDDKDWAWSQGFDDNVFLKAAIAKIEEKGWAGTVFMIGNQIHDTRVEDWIIDAPDLLQLLADGWSVGNHTWGHQCYGGFDYNQTMVDGYNRLTGIVEDSSRSGYQVIAFAAPCFDVGYHPFVLAQRASGQTAVLFNESGSNYFTLVDEGASSNYAANGRTAVAFNPDSPIGRDSRIEWDTAAVIQEIDWVASKSGPNRHIWYNTLSHGSHELSIGQVATYVYDTYGPWATNEVWVAPSDMIYSYLLVRDNTVVTWEAVGAAAPTPEPTATATATNTPVPTATATATNTPVPTATNTPMPTATATNTAVPTATNTPVPTATNTPVPTATNTPMPTATAMPTNTPAPTAVPQTGPSLERGSITNVGSTSWTTVTLGRSYSSMVVVAAANYDSSTAASVVRIRNASGNSFEVKMDSTSQTAVSGVTVHYLVVEEGVYTLAQDGVKMEAVKYISTRTDKSASWVGESRAYANSYTNPVVLGQVMTTNDPNWSVFWARGNRSTNPPSASALYTGKHVGEDPNGVRANETIGYIVIEAGNGTINGVAYAAGVGADTVRGVSNIPAYNYGISGLSVPQTAVATAVVSAAAMDGGNGGWPILYGPNPVTTTNLALAFDEGQTLDTERSHTTEQVAYIVLE